MFHYDCAVSKEFALKKAKLLRFLFGEERTVLLEFKTDNQAVTPYDHGFASTNRHFTIITPVLQATLRSHVSWPCVNKFLAKLLGAPSEMVQNQFLVTVDASNATFDRFAWDTDPPVIAEFVCTAKPDGLPLTTRSMERITMLFNKHWTERRAVMKGGVGSGS